MTEYEREARELYDSIMDRLRSIRASYKFSEPYQKFIILATPRTISHIYTLHDIDLSFEIYNVFLGDCPLVKWVKIPGDKPFIIVKEV